MVLEEHRIPLLICERDLRPGTWRELLALVSRFPNPPYMIVACRQADEELWMQVLRAGAYDLLAKPFNSVELKRTLGNACKCWRDRFEVESKAEVMAAGA
jgi:FixJ family two-component response regulator